MRARVIVREEWSEGGGGGGGGGGGNWSQRAAFRMNGGGGRPPRAYAGSGADCRPVSCNINAIYNAAYGMPSRSEWTCGTPSTQ